MSFLFVAYGVLTLALAAQAAYTAQLLHQFPSYLQWVENMVVRPNGNVLITTFDQASIFELDPNNGNAPRLVAMVPDADVAIGITEISPDVFALETGYLNRTTYQLDRSGRIDTLDFTCRGCNERPEIRTVAALPQAKLLNGMAALPLRSHVVMSADSITGTIYRTDTRTGRVDVAVEDPNLAPRANPDPFLNLLGVNGLKTHNGYLYVTSTSAQFLGRYQIDECGTPLGALETLVTYQTPRSPDDFAIARNGSVFGAIPLDSVSKATPNRADYDVDFIVNHNPELERPSAAVLSRDESTVYVSTGGRNEQGGKGGQIFAVRLT
ncbi:Six-bladed beta-propeller, TolB-like protein [Cordyceps javanica]|uniref:Six-bladed beta-propeller, TolB-like protein n=1 Tax=Cordyceps javanica TaxID=43265 RepID=A0A545V602_9HYPO|nr:Six-bladed beta-propeller, TolB-like protein [Cordyceps javanica]TQW08380.1 Six-bladed beta-propeller, TolB-like protein [Cordyceps javanica]